MVIVLNAVAGLVALAAWQRPRLRGRWVWIATIGAEVALLVQVGLGVILVSSDRYTAARFHMFYGFVGFLTIGLAFQYRQYFSSEPGTPRWRSPFFFYGVVGLFLMGVGIRAVLQVTA